MENVFHGIRSALRRGDLNGILRRTGRLPALAGQVPCFTLSFDCETEEDLEALPEILDALAAFRIPAAFACIGIWIERFPEIHREILKKGHEILNHSHTHPYHEILNQGRQFKDLSLEEKAEEIAQCHRICGQALDYSPSGFRTPHFGINHSEELYPVLRKLGYRFSSSTVVDTSGKGSGPSLTPTGIVEIPLGTSARYPGALFDTWNFLDSDKAICRDPADFTAILAESIVQLVRQKGYLTYYFDPSALTRRGILRQVLSILSPKPGLRHIPYGTIANLVRERSS
ncbi:MAG: polysaccharide deacetylase family protein [Armatimonadetes bacterium]|nr:polysaccharide deacetylase family protein [Armatimonadota bacterium]